MTGAGVVTGTSQGIAAAVAEHMRMDCERHLGAPPNEDVRPGPALAAFGGRATPPP
jgi:hypothetical protein